jgi:histidine triad (HIT) family protein
MKKHAVVTALEKAVKGLLYISETEADLEPVFWDSATVSESELLKAAGAKDGTAIEEMTLDGFFRTVSQEDKPKFAKLANVLKDDLADTKVYKIGDEAEKTIIVVGKTNGETCAGVKTTVVET